MLKRLIKAKNVVGFMSLVVLGSSALANPCENIERCQQIDKLSVLKGNNFQPAERIYRYQSTATIRADVVFHNEGVAAYNESRGYCDDDNGSSAFKRVSGYYDGDDRVRTINGLFFINKNESAVSAEMEFVEQVSLSFAGDEPRFEVVRRVRNGQIPVGFEYILDPGDFKVTSGGNCYQSLPPNYRRIFQSAMVYNESENLLDTAVSQAFEKRRTTTSMTFGADQFFPLPAGVSEYDPGAAVAVGGNSEYEFRTYNSIKDLSFRGSLEFNKMRTPRSKKRDINNLENFVEDFKPSIEQFLGQRSQGASFEYWISGDYARLYVVPTVNGVKQPALVFRNLTVQQNFDENTDITDNRVITADIITSQLEGIKDTMPEFIYRRTYGEFRSTVTQFSEVLRQTDPSRVLVSTEVRRFVPHMESEINRLRLRVAADLAELPDGTEISPEVQKRRNLLAAMMGQLDSLMRGIRTDAVRSGSSNYARLGQKLYREVQKNVDYEFANIELDAVDELPPVDRILFELWDLGKALESRIELGDNDATTGGMVDRLLQDYAKPNGYKDKLRNYVAQGVSLNGLDQDIDKIIQGLASYRQDSAADYERNDADLFDQFN